MKNTTTFNRADRSAETPYTMVATSVLRDSKLTMEERFMMSWILSHDDKYVFNTSYLAKNSQDLFGCSKTKFYKIWKSLEEKGYIEKQTLKDGNLVSGYHYTIYELGKNATTSTSARDSQNLGHPETGTLSSINQSNNTITTSQSIDDLDTIPKVDAKIQRVYNNIVGMNISALGYDEAINWKMNNVDANRLRDALDRYGEEGVNERIATIISTTGRKYVSVKGFFRECGNDNNYKHKTE